MNALGAAGTPEEGLSLQAYQGGMIRYMKANSGEKLEAIKHDNPGDVWEAFQDRMIRMSVIGASWSYGMVWKAAGQGTAERADILRARRAVAKRQRLLDHLARRHEAHQRIAGVAPCGQCRHHRLDVVFHEKHGGNDDVGPADLVDAMGQRIRIGAPVGRRMDGEREARHFAHQLRVDACDSSCEVIVECDDHHAAGHFCGPIGCNVLWHRTASRW